MVHLELLIVVATITVLAAISIPIFTIQLEKSREATDLANVHSAYAEVMMATSLNIGGVSSSDGKPSWIGVPAANGYCKITYHTAEDYVSFEWSGTADSGKWWKCREKLTSRMKLKYRDRSVISDF